MASTIINSIVNRFKNEGAEKAVQETEAITRHMTRLGQASASAGRSFSSQAQGLGGLVGAYAGAAATIIVLQQAFSALNRSAQSEQTIAGTRALAGAIGESGDKILASINKITKAQVAMSDLAEQVNIGLSAGFNTKQLEQAADVATKASIALGRNLPDSINRLLRGTAKLEPELLDELGIFTKILPAVEAYSVQTGKAASSLTDFERRQAFVNAAITEGQRKFADIDTSVDSSAQSLQKLSATISNLGQQFGNFIAVGLTPIANFFANDLTNAVALFGLTTTLVLRKGFQEIDKYFTGLQARAQQFQSAVIDKKLSNPNSASGKVFSRLQERYAGLSKAELEGIGKDLAKSSHIETDNLVKQMTALRDKAFKPSDTQKYIDEIKKQAAHIKSNILIAENEIEKLKEKSADNRLNLRPDILKSVRHRLVLNPEDTKRYRELGGYADISTVTNIGNTKKQNILGNSSGSNFFTPGGRADSIDRDTTAIRKYNASLSELADMEKHANNVINETNKTLSSKSVVAWTALSGAAAKTISVLNAAIGAISTIILVVGGAYLAIKALASAFGFDDKLQSWTNDVINFGASLIGLDKASKQARLALQDMTRAFTDIELGKLGIDDKDFTLKIGVELQQVDILKLRGYVNDLTDNLKKALTQSSASKESLVQNSILSGSNYSAMMLANRTDQKFIQEGINTTTPGFSGSSVDRARLAVNQIAPDITNKFLKDNKITAVDEKSTKVLRAMQEAAVNQVIYEPIMGALANFADITGQTVGQVLKGIDSSSFDSDMIDVSANYFDSLSNSTKEFITRAKIKFDKGLAASSDAITFVGLLDQQKINKQLSNTISNKVQAALGIGAAEATNTGAIRITSAGESLNKAQRDFISGTASADSLGRNQQNIENSISAAIEEQERYLENYSKMTPVIRDMMDAMFGGINKTTEALIKQYSNMSKITEELKKQAVGFEKIDKAMESAFSGATGKLTNPLSGQFVNPLNRKDNEFFVTTPGQKQIAQLDFLDSVIKATGQARLIQKQYNEEVKKNIDATGKTLSVSGDKRLRDRLGYVGEIPKAALTGTNAVTNRVALIAEGVLETIEYNIDLANKTIQANASVSQEVNTNAVNLTQKRLEIEQTRLNVLESINQSAMEQLKLDTQINDAIESGIREQLSNEQKINDLFTARLEQIKKISDINKEMAITQINALDTVTQSSSETNMRLTNANLPSGLQSFNATGLESAMQKIVQLNELEQKSLSEQAQTRTAILEQELSNIKSQQQSIASEKSQSEVSYRNAIDENKLKMNQAELAYQNTIQQINAREKIADLDAASQNSSLQAQRALLMIQIGLRQQDYENLKKKVTIEQGLIDEFSRVITSANVTILDTFRNVVAMSITANNALSPDQKQRDINQLGQFTAAAKQNLNTTAEQERLRAANAMRNIVQLDNPQGLFDLERRLNDLKLQGVQEVLAANKELFGVQRDQAKQVLDNTIAQIASQVTLDSITQRNRVTRLDNQSQQLVKQADIKVTEKEIADLEAIRLGYTNQLNAALQLQSNILDPIANQIASIVESSGQMARQAETDVINANYDQQISSLENQNKLISAQSSLMQAQASAATKILQARVELGNNIAQVKSAQIELNKIVEEGLQAQNKGLIEAKQNQLELVKAQFEYAQLGRESASNRVLNKLQVQSDLAEGPLAPFFSDASRGSLKLAVEVEQLSQLKQNVADQLNLITLQKQNRMETLKFELENIDSQSRVVQMDIERSRIERDAKINELKIRDQIQKAEAAAMGASVKARIEILKNEAKIAEWQMQKQQEAEKRENESKLQQLASNRAGLEGAMATLNKLPQVFAIVWSGLDNIFTGFLDKLYSIMNPGADEADRAGFIKDLTQSSANRRDILQGSIGRIDLTDLARARDATIAAQGKIGSTIIRSEQAAATGRNNLAETQSNLQTLGKVTDEINNSKIVTDFKVMNTSIQELSVSLGGSAEASRLSTLAIQEEIKLAKISYDQAKARGVESVNELNRRRENLKKLEELADQKDNNERKRLAEQLTQAQEAADKMMLVYKYTNDAFYALAADFTTTVQDNFGKGLQDLNEAWIRGTLTMSNFKEGFKDWMTNFTVDIGKNVTERLIVKPIQEEIGGFLGDLFLGKDVNNDPASKAARELRGPAGKTISDLWMEINALRLSALSPNAINDKVLNSNSFDLLNSGTDAQKSRLLAAMSDIDNAATPEAATDAQRKKLAIQDEITTSTIKQTKAFGGFGTEIGKFGIAISGTLAGIMAGTQNWKTSMLSIFASLFAQTAYSTLAKTGGGFDLSGLFNSFGSSAGSSAMPAAFSEFASAGAALSTGGKVGTGDLDPGLAGRDKQRQILQPGQFVLKKNMAERIGYKRLGMMNRGVNTILEPGEFVFTADAAKRVGYDNLMYMNAGINPAGMATGGAVGNYMPVMRQPIIYRPRQMTATTAPQMNNTPPQVEVRFENRGTPQQQVGNQKSTFDGKKLIIETVLEDLENNGMLRKKLRG